MRTIGGGKYQTLQGTHMTHDFHRHIRFETLDLRFDKRDRSVEAYAQRGWYEEFKSEFYDHVAEQLKPDLLLDVGANYGVASVFMKRKMSDAHLLSFEPNPHLLPYIQFNLKHNNVTNYEIIQAVVGESVKPNASFHVNPAGSQDSRVIAGGEGWLEITIPQVNLSNIIESLKGKRVFIKIDSQGYEESIFKGAEAFLTTSNDWLIKTEFAPHWLRSQGADPIVLLRYLVSKYSVAEYPARYGYRTNYLEVLRTSKLTLESIDSYLEYVTKLNRHDRGWVDLLVCPKIS